MSCVTAVKYSVKLNGTLLDLFSPWRGLRQGDPLSPLLFLLVEDGLSILLKSRVSDGTITPAKICRRAPGISHLLFADDTLLFFKASYEQAVGVRNVLDVYSNATGQCLNYNKCSLLFGSSCPATVHDQIPGVLNVTTVTFEEKYLGLPTPDGRLSKGKFKNLQTGLTKRLF